MLAFLYLILTTIAGRAIRRRFLSTHLIFAKFNWIAKLSADFLLGTIPLSSLNYFSALVLQRLLPESISPLTPSTILSSAFAFTAIVYVWRWERLQPSLNSTPKRTLTLPELKTKLLSKKSLIQVISLIIFSFFAWLLTAAVLRSENAHLGAGFSVFSDYAPHTAVVSSFAHGRNFPTDYPHFAGDGIQYHFFFFFLAGLLQYLGLDLATALNLPSALGLIAFCILLGTLAVHWTRREIAFLLAPLFVFLRSSNAVWHWLITVPERSREAGVSVFKYILNNDIFIGRLPNDDWGLWNLNVFANQRHLLFVLAAAILILMIFYPSLKDASLKTWLKPSEWNCKDWTPYIPAFMLLVFLPYWHGSVTIAILLVLAFMAIWSQAKLAYIVAAASAILMSFVYTAAFSGGAGNVLSPQFHWGFIAENKSFFGVVAYLWELLGLSFIAIIILPFFQSRKWKRIVSAGMALPLLFAITISLTPDVTVNHKYIMISQIFATILSTDVILRLWRLRAWRFKYRDKSAKERVSAIPIGRIAAITLSILLTATGLIDLITYRNKNKNIFWIAESSPFQSWIMEETEADAIFLTGPWHYHPFFLTGRKVWYGHSYYAWSAGHDTASREVEVQALFQGSGEDPKLFIDYCMQNSIQYVIISDDLRMNPNFSVNESFFAENFELVAQFLESDNSVIYQIY